jgi:hypothetical protein
MQSYSRKWKLIVIKRIFIRIFNICERSFINAHTVVEAFLSSTYELPSLANRYLPAAI